MISWIIPTWVRTFGRGWYGARNPLAVPSTRPAGFRAAKFERRSSMLTAAVIATTPGVARAASKVWPRRRPAGRRQVRVRQDAHLCGAISAPLWTAASDANAPPDSTVIRCSARSAARSVERNSDGVSLYRRGCSVARRAQGLALTHDGVAAFACSLRGAALAKFAPVGSTSAARLK
jgi:hypothetical protein